MRAASILLALVVVLGFVRKAGALYEVDAEHDYTIHLGGKDFGFIDGALINGFQLNPVPFRWVCLGPFGHYDVPFTATQGLVGFCLILAMLIIVPAVLTVRWRKRATA